MRCVGMDTNTGTARKSALGRWLSEPAFTRRGHGSFSDSHLPTADRKLLEGIVLPFYASAPDVERILVIGAAEQKLRLVTGKQVDHVMPELDALPVDGSYDLVIVIGVLGSELSDPTDCDRLLAACYLCLRPGGHLLVGWNDLPDSLQVDALPVLDCFAPYVFPPLHAARQLADTFTRHTFQFFRKPTSALDG